VVHFDLSNFDQLYSAGLTFNISRNEQGGGTGRGQPCANITLGMSTSQNNWDFDNGVALPSDCSSPVSLLGFAFDHLAVRGHPVQRLVPRDARAAERSTTVGGVGARRQSMLVTTLIKCAMRAPRVRRSDGRSACRHELRVTRELAA
jgi:hypothetical protein